MTQTYRLNILDVTHNQTHTINFPGIKTLLEVKLDVSDLTNIPVRYQLWTGWPPNTTDDVCKAPIKLDSVVNVLTYLWVTGDIRSVWNQPCT